MMEQRYLGAWDFPRDITATISKVEGVKLEGTAVIKANKKPVISFKNADKQLVVNATIGKTIAGMYGPNTDDWVGKRITLYATTCKLKGETVECVRVRPNIPKAQGEAIVSQPVPQQVREAQNVAASKREPGEDDT